MKKQRKSAPPGTPGRPTKENALRAKHLIRVPPGLEARLKEELERLQAATGTEWSVSSFMRMAVKNPPTKPTGIPSTEDETSMTSRYMVSMTADLERKMQAGISRLQKSTGEEWSVSAYLRMCAEASLGKHMAGES